MNKHEALQEFLESSETAVQVAATKGVEVLSIDCRQGRYVVEILVEPSIGPKFIIAAIPLKS